MDTNDQARGSGGVSAAPRPAGTPDFEAPDRPPLRIFINYRHEDVPFAAPTLYRELRGQFGAENIFFDAGTLKPGTEFLAAITSHLSGTAGAFLALIGPGWQRTMDAHQRRGDDDYVAEEIDLALRNRWTVIPVLLNDAPLPAGRDLPLAIRALPRHHVARLRLTSLDADIEDLVGRLHEISPRPPTEERDGDPVKVDPPVENGNGNGNSQVREADDVHYQTLADEADNLVIFLGAGANADDREGPFRLNASMLPDDADIAEYLAVQARLTSPERELAEVAQYARMFRGEPRVYGWVKDITVHSAPGPAHRYLARLPRRLEELGLEKRYQMIVTSKFDVALEQAFLEAKEPFDVAIYMAPGTEHAGRFVHVKWRDVDPQPVLEPNKYLGFPMAANGQLTRTVIVRINGAIDDPDIGYPWKNNYVITEDHYIDYLGGRLATDVVPAQILAKLRQSSCLFLGYALADWRLRVFLHWIWPGSGPSGTRNWAVQCRPSTLEQRFWEDRGVGLYRARLNDYIHGFDRFLVANRGDLR